LKGGHIAIIAFARNGCVERHDIYNTSLLYEELTRGGALLDRGGAPLNILRGMKPTTLALPAKRLGIKRLL
jgi:hypothetical protein